MQYQQYDVVVGGGGAAGLSAALVLARSRRSVLVLDAGQPRNAPAAHMHNFLSRDGLSPAEFVSVGQAEVRANGGEINSATVTDVESTSTGFDVTLDTGRTTAARRLRAALSVLPRLRGA